MSIQELSSYLEFNKFKNIVVKLPEKISTSQSVTDDKTSYL
jgi:hypothetical protein